MRPTILIVDDEKNTREGLRQLLEDHYDVYTARDIETAMGILKDDQIDLLLADLRLGAEDGMGLVDAALGLAQPPVCIMMTAYGNVDSAVEAMKRGAYDFLTKPLNLENLELLVRRALNSRRLEQENVELRHQIDRRYGLENLIGNSPAMQEVTDTIRQVAPSRATILIEGESGTGKELAAHAIHNLSKRNRAKFVAVHCAALSDSLLESELFGHERGSFTGATGLRIGRFEQADGGTLFLDEIGEIDHATQVKILRVLGERVVERVGANRPIQVDVRIVAATNRDLAAMVARGEFREDLFHRINVVRIVMPPLRARREDIPQLALAFLREFARENDKPDIEIGPETMRALIAHDWPGNVRELRTAIEHGVVMARGRRIGVRDLPAPLRDTLPGRGPGGGRERAGSGDGLNLHDAEIRLMIRALEETGGNKSKAARRLGISRRTLHRKIKEFQIESNP